MKQYFKVKISFVFVVIATLFQSQLFAQTPSNGIIFQAVARDQYSNPAKDRKIFVQSSIIQSSVSGVKVLLEEHETTTDASGVFSISVGNGKRIGGTVTTLGLIDWSQGPYYLNLKIAITPIAPVTGWDYTKDLIDLGTSPFGTVPYALYAGNVFGLDKKMNIADSAKYVTPAQLAAKTFDQTPILNSIATKLNIADSITKYVTPSQLATKTFDSTAIYNQLALKANTTTVNTALATKLNIADSISKYVTPAQLAAKTFDSTAIYNQLALKANTTDVTTALGLKANTTDVNTALGLKANTTDVNTALGLKANTNDVTTALSTKENTANKSLDVSLDGASDVKFPSVKAIKTYVDASIVANTTPLTFSAPLSKSGFTVSIPQANGSNNGYLNSTDWTSFNNKIDATQKAANNGVATLGNDGKIPSNQIPAISFQNVSVVNSSSAMTSISGAQVGSIAIRTDNNNNYVLSALPSSTLSNWIALATPIYVSTVNGFAGPNVVLTTNDVSEGANNKYYTDARVRGALSATAPLTFNSTTGAFAIPQASTTADGFLSATDWNTFKNKQNALVAGTDYVTPSGSITGNAGNVTGIVSVANGGTGSSTAVGALANLGAEPTANKSNDVAADAASTIKFPSVKAIKDYVDLQSANAGVADNSLTSAKINGTIAIGKGGTGASTAAAARTNLGLVIGTDVMSANFTTTLTGDVTGSGNGSFATTVNSVGGITAATIAGLPTSVNANTLSITANTNSIATINTNVSANTASITAETTRATNAESALDTRVTSNTASITAETTRATNAESSLDTRVTANTASITAETTRATNAESGLDTRITSNTASITTNTADILLRAPLASPAFTGVPTAPTPLTSDNSTKIATTEYVKASITAANAGLSSIGAVSTTSNAKGAIISGTTELILTPADANFGGIVTTATQTFAGAKTFTNTVSFGKDITVNGMTFGRPANPFASNSQNIAIGNNVLGKYAPTAWTTDYNIGIGYSALFNLTNGGENVAIGSTAMYLLSSGDYNTGIGSSVMSLLTTGNNNTVLGAEAGRGISTGSENTFIGSYTGVGMSGSNNILIGSNKANNSSLGTGITTGSSNTIIGSGIRNLPATLSNNVILADGDGNIRAQHNGTTGWTLGTIVSGTWSGTTIGSNVGGAGTVNGLMKANGSGVVSAAVAGTDYLIPSGNAATATKFAATKNINGVAFDGSADITIAADANTLSGTTLASNVTGSSLTSVGTITTGVWSATEIAIAKGGTGATTASGALTNLGAEATANKSTATDLGGASTSDVFFPSQKAVKTYVDAQTAAAGVSDGSITSAKITDGTIVNADVSTTAAIAFSKLNIAKSDITALGIQESLTAGSGISINAGTISATGLTTSNLASNAAITNAQLANSTTTLGSTTMTLGGTITSVTGLSALSATNLTGALTGNASTATALATGRTISTTGDITYSSGSFDGSGDVTGVATLAASGVSSGTYGSSTAIPVITVDTKGRITSASTVGIIAGVNSLNYTSTTSYAAGGTISGTSLTLAAADATNPGLISTGAQTIAGAKTFSSDVTATNFLGNATTATTAGNITATSNTSLTSITNLATVGTITAGTWSATEIAISKGGTGATTASGARTNLGLGSIATKSTIADADVDASAAIAFSKLNITKANITGLGVQEGLTAGSGISISAGTISATGLTTSNLASNAAITNAQLANSTTTLGSTTMTLGGTVTSVTGLTSLTATTVVGSLSGTATTATNIAGGLIGSIPYQTAAGTTALLAGNTTSTVKYLASSGNGTNSTAPTWVTPSFVPYTGATSAVNLGAYDLTVNGITVGKGNTGDETNTALGASALQTNSGGVSNTGIGYYALKTTNGNGTTGSYNVALGYSALSANTTGSFNVASGANTLASNISGNKNSAFGNQSLNQNTTGGNNVGFGFSSLYSVTTASDNTAIGTLTGYGLTTGARNTLLGSYAGAYFSTGNTSADNNTTGLNSVFIGYDVRPLANGDDNEIVISGYNGTPGTTPGTIGWGSNSTSIGNTKTQKSRLYGALTVTANSAAANMTGTSSTIAAQNATTATFGGGDLNLNAGNAGTTGLGGNIVLTPGTSTTAANNGIVKINGQVQITGGSPAAGEVLTSDANGLATWAAPTGITALAAIGSTANANGASISGSTLNLQPASANYGGIVTTGTQTFAGSKTFNSDLKVNDLTVGKGPANFTTLVGQEAGLAMTSSGQNNVAVGYQALTANTSGTGNVAVGSIAGSSLTTGASNVALGSQALRNATSGFSNTAIGAGSLSALTDASGNIGIGSSSGSKLTTGDYNINIGSSAGTNIGSGSVGNTTGNYSIMIGTQTRPAADGETNQIVIAGGGSGILTTGLGSNTTLIGSSATTTSRIMGALTLPNTTSSSSTTTGALIVSGGTGIAGALNVGGATTITGAATISNTTASSSTTTGALKVGGGAGIVGNVNVGGTLGVTGATTLSSTLSAGATTLASSSITGNETVGGTLGVTGATTVSTLTASGNATLTSLTATGAATFSSTVTIPTGAGLNKVLTSDANGGATWKSGYTAISTKTDSYTLTLDDNFIIIGSATATGKTFTLPTAVGCAGKEFTIKNLSAFSVSIATTSSQKIIQDNTTTSSTSATIGIEPSNNWIKLISDGTDWIAFRALF